MRGCMKQRTVVICGENTRDFLLLEEHVCAVVPDAVIVKYTKGELLVADLRENRNNFDIIFISSHNFKPLYWLHFYRQFP